MQDCPETSVEFFFFFGGVAWGQSGGVTYHLHGSSGVEAAVGSWPWPLAAL